MTVTKAGAVFGSVVAMVGVLVLAAFSWEQPRAAASPALGALRDSLPHRAACAGDTVLCRSLSNAEVASPPLGPLAGLRFACVSPIVDGMPSALTAAFADQLEPGESITWTGDELAIAPDRAAAEVTAACLQVGSCGAVRRGAGASEVVTGEVEWARTSDGTVWLAVERGAGADCVAVSVFPDVEPAEARFTTRLVLRDRLP
jgi:hypothetical protein